MSAHRRMKGVDVVKGIAIALVVYGHVIQGVHHRGWWDSPSYFFQERFIYSFHMAAFFFVSGLFVQGSLARSSSGEFVVQRLRTVLWPYIVCAAVENANFFFGQNAGRGSANFVRDVLIPLVTGDASWFLPTLFLCLLLALVTNRLPAWARFGLAAVLVLLWPLRSQHVYDRAAAFFVFLAAGEWVGPRIGRLESVPRWAALAGSAVLFTLVAAANWNPLGDLAMLSGARCMVILLGLAGLAGLFFAASALRHTWLESALAWLGMASLGIFVLHPFFQGVVRIFLARLTPSHAVLPNVLIPTVIAIAGPALLWHFRAPLRIGFLFEFPWGSPRNTPPASKKAVAPLVPTGSA